MKKFLLFLMFAMFCIPWVANAQTTVEIGDGTTAGYYTPIGTYYNYSITEQLYTADEIGTAGSITSISFYYAYSAAKEFPITVYMANVDAADLSTGISLADADEVFNGTLSVTAAGWATIDLDAPFAYDGVSNLLIGVNKGYCQWFSGSTWNYTSVANMARYTQNDNNAYDVSTVPGTLTNNRPNIQLTIVAGSVSVCEKPATMEASNVTTNSAVLTWTGGSGTYNVEYMGGDVTEWTSYLTNTTATSANLSGLNPGTAYQYRVQSVCADGVSGWKSVNFSTMFGIPLIEEFGTAIPDGWSMYTGLLGGVLADTVDLVAATYGWSFGTGNNVFDNHARCNIYSNYQRWLVLPTITMEDNVQLMFDLALTVYTSGSNASPTAGEQADDKFVVLVQTDRGWEVLRQWDNAGSEYVYDNIPNTGQTVTIDLSSYAGQNIAIAFYGESTEAGGDNNLHIDNVSIDYIPACPKPTGLAVNYENGTTATVTWEGNAAGYELDVNGTTYTTTDNTYSLTGLELATDYEVKVRANCGANGYSDWTNTVSFTTELCMPEDQCALTFVVTDSYGDGWNGASINIYDYTGEEVGDLLTSITNTSTAGAGEAQTYTFSFCNGQELAIIWTEGSYDSEASYTVTDLNGDVVVEGDGEGFDGFAYTMDCTETDCRRPSDFVAGNIGGHSVELSWTENGPATEWVIAYMSENDTTSTEITVSTNPYILTGLTPETAYAARVTPVCEVEKPSEVIYWTTDVACPAPSDLTVTPYPTSAEVSWNGFSDSYTIEWAEAGQNVTPAVGDTLLLQYDNGTYYTNIGSTSSGTRTWGVMYPAGMLQGNNTLTKVAVQENATYYTADYTINIYTGGDQPETLVGTQTVTPTGQTEMHEIELSSPISIDPLQNLWITVTATGTYVMSACQSTEPNNQWWDNNADGVWTCMATDNANLAAYGWMIRGYVTGYNAEAYTWNSAESTSPYTITGLSPETGYFVRVKGDCGEEGESAWAFEVFTTPSACELPNTLAAEVDGTTATLSWTGYQESFTLKYRKQQVVDPTTPATIILEAHNPWADSTGYQMLLDADATAYGNEIPESGPYTDSVYSAFEYLIPENADCNSYTENIVLDGIVTIQIPAGVYDWCIVNPYPGGNMWIAGDGEIPSRYDDFVFEPGVTYHFTMQTGFGTGDGAVYEVTRPMGDWITVENVTSPYELTGLDPETYYEWYVEGINADCDGDIVSEIATFTTGEQSPQVIALNSGITWVSFNVETTLDDLKAALVAAVPGTAIKIYGQSNNTTYDPARNRWSGNLTWDVTKMYKIKVTADCEITLEGTPINPADYTVTIVNGNNYLGFPFSQNMSLTDAFAGFAVNGDKIQGQTGSATYTRGRWQGSTLTELQPGKGYIYKSSESGSRTFTFPVSAR